MTEERLQQIAAHHERNVGPWLACEDGTCRDCDFMRALMAARGAIARLEARDARDLTAAS